MRLICQGRECGLSAHGDEATVDLLALLPEWIGYIANLHYHRSEARRYELQLAILERRRRSILATLDGEDYDAILDDRRLSLLTGSHGCQHAEAIFGGEQRATKRRLTK